MKYAVIKQTGQFKQVVFQCKDVTNAIKYAQVRIKAQQLTKLNTETTYSIEVI